MNRRGSPGNGSASARLAHYELIERLGSGSMGTVYRAIDQRFGTVVAVKVVAEHLAQDAAYLERFRREAHTASKLTSPYTVRLLDFGAVNGRHYLAMEFVDGLRLSDIIARGPLEVAEALAIAAQIALALDEAESRGIVHRDIKPDNVLVGRDGVVKVTDFGIARLTYAAGLTMPGMFVGTVAYAAPEQQRGQSDTRSDIYSVGVTLFQMLAGERPFEAETAASLMRLHEEALPPLERLSAPATVVEIVERCLRKSPAHRYQHPSELVAAVEAARFEVLPTEHWLSDAMAGLSRRIWGTSPVDGSPAAAATRLGFDAGAAAGSAVERAFAGVRGQGGTAHPDGTRGGRGGVGAGVAGSAVGLGGLAGLPAQPRLLAALLGGAGLAVAGLTFAFALNASHPTPTVVSGGGGGGIVTSGGGRSAGGGSLDLTPVATPTAPAAPTASPTTSPTAPAATRTPAATASPIRFPGLGGSPTPAAPPLTASPAPSGLPLIARDTFDDPVKGVLSKESSNPTRYELGYRNGEYVIRKIDATWDRLPYVVLKGTYTDATIAIDVRMVEGLGNGYVALGCRDDDNGAHYRFGLNPATGFWWLDRFSANDRERLLSGEYPKLVRPNGTNHMELRCVGATISASLNGTELGSTRDTTLKQGYVWLGAGSFSDSPAVVETRFDNLEARGVAVAAKASPTATAAPAKTVTATPGGRVLLSDDFENPTVGVLPRQSSDPKHYTAGYDKGTYVLRKEDPEWEHVLSAYLPSNYTDTVIAVDARLVGEAEGRYVHLGCRDTNLGGYRLSVEPDEGAFWLARWDIVMGWTTLVPYQTSPAVRTGTATNRIELGCAGDTLTARINGTQVASVRDTTFPGGRLWIGTCSCGLDEPAIVETRFDNLVVEAR